ncbi:ParB/RepB/Spo0J family partition protein [Gluconacetobacter sp. 1b LMG 1731]|uniref:ParB/RepB/Spo0J family partition protein n=1 Tax=Gluconacetobacter dulcium TaxID=2729096 RepID=A0A7W4NSE8_9PROT|nr:ParB/RepB/Spo0J family partition protein [Gluconacetobacter dulcium]MBB2164561.1 ParB/RepB/Spo0J family partition protein [Gluconacetobacter dulcium]MBB2193672.1 ParB/RepB/Spo0J family partition protein [Gluconacetobacter dulcium]
MSPIPRRKGPSPLMNSIGQRVSSLESNFVSSNRNHSFEVDASHVEPDPTQARKTFPEASIDELAESLKKHGQLAPVLLRPKPGERNRWIIVAGERRWRAAERAGIHMLVAIKCDKAFEVASLVENLHRENLNPVEEAYGIKRLMEKEGWNQREAAKEIGKSPSELSGLLRIIDLPEDFLSAVLTSEFPISRNMLVELSRLPDGPSRTALMERALSGSLTIRELRNGMQEPSSSKVSASRNGPGNAFSGRLVDKLETSLRKISRDALSEDDRGKLRTLSSLIADLLDAR